MSQKKEKENNIGSYLDELNKNEEDLLAFSSKYKTNIYKEEDVIENENELKNVGKKLSGESTSISQEYSNIRGYNFIKLNTLPKEEDVTNRKFSINDSSNKSYIEYQEKRKLSSPLCCYYDGSDIYLSQRQKNIIDLDNSQNFIRKDSIFNNSEKINNKINDVNDIHNLNINLLYQNKNKYFSLKNKNENECNNTIGKNNDMKRLSLNMNQIPYNKYNYDIMPNNNINNNCSNIYFQNNNYSQQIFNINYININNFQNNPINIMNNNTNKRKLTYNIEDEIIGNFFNNILNLNNNRNPNDQIFIIPQAQTKLSPILFSYNEEQEKFIKYDINRRASNKSIISNQKNEKKPFDKRKGDWLCPECHNLNFAVRVVCNRCQIPKP